MSLLMDALRKAERAKQAEEEAQQKDTPKAAPPTRDEGLSLSPETEPREKQKPEDEKTAPPAGRLGFGTSAGIGDLPAAPPFSLALEEIESREEAPEPEAEPELSDSGASAPSPPAESAPASAAKEPESLSLVEDSLTGAEKLPLDRGAKRRLSFEGDEVLTDTFLEELRPEKKSPAAQEAALSEQPAPKMELEIEQTAEYSADDSTAPSSKEQPDKEPRREAQAVFDAKARPGGQAKRWGLLGGVPAGLLILALGGYYFWTQYTGGPSLVPAGTATMRPAPRPLPPSPQPSEPSTSVARAPAAGPGPDAQMQCGKSEYASVEPVPQQAAAAAPGAQEAPSEEPRAAEVVSGETFTSPYAPADSVAADPGLTSPGVVESGDLRIARRQVPDKVEPLLRSGFDAFYSGAYAVAEASYRDVLAQEPKNRDALLGLAAVSVRRGEWEAAASLYLKVLSINPKDSVAQAGLLGLQRNLDPVAAESRIKLLLEQEPDAGHLYFSLGNLYAMQRRWNEAQGAYFNAYRSDGRNADYAYNLAVSLDQLAERGAALTYYRRALDLADGRAVGFESAAVRQRIQSIAGSSTSP